MKYANVPFPNGARSSTRARTAEDTHPPRPSAPSATRGSKARQHASKSGDPASKVSTESVSKDDDEGETETSALDTARYTVDDSEEYDEMDIFSPLLSPDRRIVDSKISGGLTLYKTANDQWLSEAELQRMANIARNAGLMRELGIEEAKRPFTARPATPRDDDDGNALEVEDDREFAVARSRTTLQPRESLPRQSKQNVT